MVLTGWYFFSKVCMNSTFSLVTVLITNILSYDSYIFEPLLLPESAHTGWDFVKEFFKKKKRKKVCFFIYFFAHFIDWEITHCDWHFVGLIMDIQLWVILNAQLMNRILIYIIIARVSRTYKPEFSQTVSEGWCTLPVSWLNK